MNKDRRSRLVKLAEQFETGLIEADDLKGELESIREEEDEYRENMPENMQQSERYYTSEEASDNINSAIDAIDDLSDIEDAEELEDKKETITSSIRDAAA